MPRVYLPGEVIPITLNGKVYQTVIDDRGVQRFKINTVTRALLDASKPSLDLNKIAAMFYEGHFSLEDYLEFNMALGYSVCGLMDFDAFSDLPIENPVWN